MYGVSDNSGNHSLNGQQFKTHWTDTITSPPKFGPLAQNSSWYYPNFVCHFLFHFLRIEILELTATKHSWTYLHLNVRNKLSFMNVLVQLLHSLRHGFLTFFCATDPSDSLVKFNDPFSEKYFKYIKQITHTICSILQCKSIMCKYRFKNIKK